MREWEWERERELMRKAGKWKWYLDAIQLLDRGWVRLSLADSLGGVKPCRQLLYNLGSLLQVIYYEKDYLLWIFYTFHCISPIWWVSLDFGVYCRYQVPSLKTILFPVVTRSHRCSRPWFSRTSCPARRHRAAVNLATCIRFIGVAPTICLGCQVDIPPLLRLLRHCYFTKQKT